MLPGFFLHCPRQSLFAGSINNVQHPTWSHVEHVDMLTVCQLPQGAYNRDLQCGVLRACLADQPNQDWFTLRCKSAVMRLNGTRSNSNFRMSHLNPFIHRGSCFKDILLSGSTYKDSTSCLLEDRFPYSQRSCQGLTM